MAKNGNESTSDGLEIVSIGKLYAGAWDKKYWSSSRGKDRYPYPIGYQALRTHNGLTYKMEVHEGAKGPIFQVTTNDKQSGSGETPDRACGNFQKKSCSRVKLLHGKRFSGKVDGVEFFGFKNALVQRLLRELVATINDASDQSSLFPNSNKASAKGRDMGQPFKTKSPELMSYLDKTRVTGKRSRICRDVNTKSACKRSHKICQPFDEAAARKDPCCTRSADYDEPLISSTSNCCQANQADEPSLVLSDMELEKNVSSSGNGLPIKSMENIDDSKAKSSLTEGQSELASMEKCSSASLVNGDLPRVEKLTQEENGKAQVISDVLDSRPAVLMDSLVNHSTDSCAPDALEGQQGSSGRGEDAPSRFEPVADTVFSEKANSGSHPEDQSCFLTNSEKSDFDSAGDDIANSMLAILLPEAIPLLTYSSRKKKRKARPSKELSHGLNIDDKSVGTNPPSGVISPAGAHDKSVMEGVKRAHVSSVSTHRVGSVLENVKYCVPDSLDDDQSEDHASTKLPPSCNDAEKVAVVQENCEPYGEVSLHAVDLSYLKSKTGGHKAPEELAKNSDMRAKDSVPASRSIPTNTSAGGKPRNNAAEIIPSSVSKNSSPVDTAPSNSDRSKTSFGVQGKLERNISYTKDEDVQESSTYAFKEDGADFVDGCDLHARNSQVYLHKNEIGTQYCRSDHGAGGSQNFMSHIDEDLADTGVNSAAKQKSSDEVEGNMKLIGCYSHPMQISSVKIAGIGHEIYICVSCGLAEDRTRDLFLYKLSRKEPSQASPCMVGHTSMRLPSLKDEFCREVSVDKSGLQFAPDAQSLVLTDSIRMPDCSMRMEEHIILSYDFLSSRVIELKRVPKSASLLIGHNGYGQFSLWDIAKRTLITEFSASSSSVLGYLPVSLFRWQHKCLPLDKLPMEECVKELVEETMLWFAGHNEVSISCPKDGKDVALSNVPSAGFSSNYHSYSDGCWRLGLLAKNTVIVGAALPSSISGIGTSAGIGIIGTYKGHVDIWEMATGSKTGSLHHHAGKAVSHVVVDDSSSVVAIAHDDGQLWVYLHR